jgi:hypothetical protein
VARLVSGEEAGRELSGSHLLLLPEELPAEVVVGLVRARHPEVAPAREGGWRLGRWTALAGPVALDEAAAAAAGVPAPWRVAWSLTCPAEREGAPLAGATDREGLHRAFADGLPVRAERRAVDLALALARRLSGAVRVVPSGVLLEPDPSAWVDRVVHSPHWLLPEQALRVVAGAVPAARLAVDGQPWQGLRPEAVAALEAPGAGAGLDERVREGLHLAADASDAEAVAREDDLEAYALAVDLGSDGVVEVRVGVPEAPVGVLAGVPWAGGAVAYAVTWWPPDEAAAEVEQPAAGYLASRARAAAVVGRVSGALSAVLGGVVVDADGFPAGHDA